MSVDLMVCPDCGGFIGADGTDGRKPCTCFKDHNGGKSDTVAMESPVRADVSASAKRCITCGKDVTGHRRVKDSRGYMCYACAKEERASEKVGTLPCAECGRRVRPEGLVQFGAIRICKRCHNDHKEVKKRAVKKIATRHYEIHEKRTLIYLSIAFVILLVLVIYATIRWKTHYSRIAPTFEHGLARVISDASRPQAQTLCPRT